MSGKGTVKKVAIAADHRGVEMKKNLTDFLTKQGYQVSDLGVNTDAPCDYPDVAFPLSQKVAKGEFDRGILVCMSGTGMAICANKVKGIRAAICENIEHAKLSREHNDANVLILGAKFIGTKEACELTEEWLSTDFEGGRHSQRVQKIIDFENNQK